MCAACNERFAGGPGLPLHLALYLANNCQSECGTCGERFCYKPDLGYHLVCHHTGYHNADFRFDPELTCVVCGVRFAGGPDSAPHLALVHTSYFRC